MIATAAATDRVAQRRRETEEAAPVWGEHPRRRSRSGLVRPEINAKPGSILPADGQQDVTRGLMAGPGRSRQFFGVTEGFRAGFPAPSEPRES